jgi:hypothetical protein
MKNVEEGSVRTARDEEVYGDSFSTGDGEVLSLEDSWLGSLTQIVESPVDSWRYRYMKRAIDLSLAPNCVRHFSYFKRPYLLLRRADWPFSPTFPNLEVPLHALEFGVPAQHCGSATG